MTLTEFLLARIAEDEAEGKHLVERSMTRAGYYRSWRAECEAKRAIVETIDPEDFTGKFVVKTLATAYAAHPDYREEWRP